MGARYQGCIPRDLRRAYEKAVTDETLLCLRDDFALLEARLMQLLETMDKQPQPSWPAIFAAIDRAEQSGSVEELRELARNQASAQIVLDAAWAEVRGIIQERSKIASAEVRRLESLHQMLTKEQALRFVARLVAVVTKHVADQGTLMAIKHDMGGVTVQG